MKTFEILKDIEDWKNFVYKIKLRLNQVEDRSDVHGRSFLPLQSVTETDSKSGRPMLLREISTHPAHRKFSTTEMDCHGTFTFLHMLIISKNMIVLR